MKKYRGTRYNSFWDKWTFLIIALVAGCFIFNLVIDDDIWNKVICLIMLIFVCLTFLGIYYRIDEDKLVVYTFFIPKEYPILKIKSITPTDSVLSAPAVSLSHRLAITFIDKKLLKSNIPLIISPKAQKDFLQQLIDINPAIEHDGLII